MLMMIDEDDNDGCVVIKSMFNYYFWDFEVVVEDDEGRRR